MRRALFAALLLSLLLLPACGGEKTPSAPPAAGGPGGAGGRGGGAQAAPVTVATAVRKAIPERISAVGTVEPSAVVEVRSQVGGALLEVLFREGQEVRAGDLLFRIDPRPFEAALRQKEADLARDAAQLENARRNLARSEELAAKGMVAAAERDTARSAVSMLEATLEADRAAVETARLSLAYTSIIAPQAGRTGSVSADAGNLVRANGDTPLVVINRLDPAYLSFSVPERDLPRVLAAKQAGPVRVTALVEGQPPREGALSFIENQVDRGSGTIRLRATFPNRDRALWPGLFARAEITLGVREGALVVPSSAVQLGQAGPFALVVKDDLTAEVRPLTVSLVLDGETVVESGLAPGERVVTDGHLRVTPGGKVAIKGDAAAPAPAKAPRP